MPDTPTLFLFALASLALLVIPGPSVLFIVARSLEQGRAAGLASVLGVQLGALVHVVFALLGLSALLFQSAFAFSFVKYAGAAYLIYLGLRTLLSKTARDENVIVEVVALPRVFLQGFLVNVLNPKTALFFLAFLPQFVHPERGAVAPQVALLGMLFIALATVSDGLYALLAGSVGRSLRGRPHFAQTQKAIAGTVYLALGVTAVFSGRK